MGNENDYKLNWNFESNNLIASKLILIMFHWKHHSHQLYFCANHYQ